MRLLAAPDKFRGSASARAIANAIGVAAWEAGWDCLEVPMSDGGEGLLDIFGGPNRQTSVRGPLGNSVDAPWRISRGLAVIESAAACGIELAGGPTANDPLAADTTGVGELMLAALHGGAQQIIVGLGGSASTDGGFGAVRAIADPARFGNTEIIAACDVDIKFLDAARRFAPQKGATQKQVVLLERRLQATAARYRNEFGVDVCDFVGAGAAGGLAGGLAAIGARLESGFTVVADERNIAAQLDAVDLIVTGEGLVDEASYEGKVVGGLVAMAHERNLPILVIGGDVDIAVADVAPMVNLTQRFGHQRSMTDTTSCVREIVAEHLTGLGHRVSRHD